MNVGLKPNKGLQWDQLDFLRETKHCWKTIPGMGPIIWSETEAQEDVAFGGKQ